MRISVCTWASLPEKVETSTQCFHPFAAEPYSPIAKKVDNRGTKQGAADPTMGKQYKHFFPDAESLVMGKFLFNPMTPRLLLTLMTTPVTYYDTIMTTPTIPIMTTAITPQ